MNIIREIQKHLFPKTLKCVYRKDILKYALKHYKSSSGSYYSGLCILLIIALKHYSIHKFTENLRYIFPLFVNDNAHVFNSRKISIRSQAEHYWWPSNVWNTGRLDFLKWLLEQYKDDKTNLKEL